VPIYFWVKFDDMEDEGEGVGAIEDEWDAISGMLSGMEGAVDDVNGETSSG